MESVIGPVAAAPEFNCATNRPQMKVSCHMNGNVG